ncbi:hypothetical protein [Lihuaxuella thermophila]|uniref:Uncharacterized protein n=1 Tax=Lihuaxuella thermophila TaxID=1173111 RepID=A0A1H8D928_9BACL|nr:hypothetical protein [Lihuaxuella thermophila]SEN03078.1 hypothetical protein SAMN05444955_10524 [Lihuaxuella thermophila]
MEPFSRLVKGIPPVRGVGEMGREAKTGKTELKRASEGALF